MEDSWLEAAYEERTELPQELDPEARYFQEDDDDDYYGDMYGDNFPDDFDSDI